MNNKPPEILFSKRFEKQLEKAPTEIKKALRNRIGIFRDDQYSSSLNIHSLGGKLKGLRSFNVTGDWRALYSLQRNEEGNQVVILEALGTHSELYKK